MRALALVALLASVAHADRKDAERYFHYGEQAWKAQNFEAAAQQFEHAYQAMPLPEIAFSAAQAYRRQYRVDQKPSDVARAIELYRAYLDKVRTGGRVADAADALAEMQRELERLIKAGVKVSAELAAEHTQLGVNVVLGSDDAHGVREIEDAPTTAAIITATIDNAPVAPYAPTNVVPGKHAIHVEAPGYVPDDRTLEITAGDFHMVDVTLRAKPAHLAIATPAHVAIDGRDAGEAPLKVDIAAGKHLIALLHDGRDVWSKDLVVERGQDIALSPTLTTSWKRRATERVAIAGAATGVLALAAMTVALVEDSHASSLHDDFTTTGDQMPAALHDYNNSIRYRNDAVAAMWLFGALTVAAGVTTAVLYYSDKPTIALTGRF